MHCLHCLTAWRKGLQEGVSDPSAPVKKPGQGTALPTGLQSSSLSDRGNSSWQHHGPGNARARLGRWHRPGMASSGGMGKCILSGGRERCGCELYLWDLRTAPSHSSSMHLWSDWRWAAPLSCACRPLEGAGLIPPLFSMSSSGCPVSWAADALSLGRCSRVTATCQQRCPSVTAAVAAGCCADREALPCSAALAGGCPNSKQTLPVAAGNKVDPEIPELWEVGFNVINCNRRRGQIIGAKVSL